MPEIPRIFFTTEAHSLIQCLVVIVLYPGRDVTEKNC